VKNISESKHMVQNLGFQASRPPIFLVNNTFTLFWHTILNCHNVAINIPYAYLHFKCLCYNTKEGMSVSSTFIMLRNCNEYYKNKLPIRGNLEVLYEEESEYQSLSSSKMKP